MDRKDMTGVLFIEENRKSEKHPLLKGQMKVEGKDYQIAVWKNVSQKGKQYYSLKINEPLATSLSTETNTTPAPAFNEDDIPF